MNVLITGSSRGLGRSLALAFACAGHGVVLHGRDEAKLNDVAIDLDALGCAPEIVVGDIREDQTLYRLFQAALKWDIDVLVNNAAHYYCAPVIGLNPYDVGNVLQTNLVAPARLVTMIYPLFINHGHGQIVNINSLAGKTPNGDEAAYCASKYGLRGFMESLKYGARKDNVGVLDVYMGAMRTDMSAHRQGCADFIDPDEAASIIVGLCNDHATCRVNEIEIGRR